MPPNHTATVIVAIYSSVLPSKQWDIVKSQLYHCWVQLYGPLFWIVSALLCLWDSRPTAAASYHRITIMEVPTSTRHTASRTPYELETANEPFLDQGSTAAATAASQDTLSDTDKDPGSMSTTTPSTETKHKKSFKRTIKGHMQTIKQKQHSLNEAVKRTIRRRPSHIKSRNVVDLHHPLDTTSSYESMSRYPALRRNSFPSTANKLVNPFRRKTAPAIFNQKR